STPVSTLYVVSPATNVNTPSDVSTHGAARRGRLRRSPTATAAELVRPMALQITMCWDGSTKYATVSTAIQPQYPARLIRPDTTFPSVAPSAPGTVDTHRMSSAIG